MYLDFKDIVLVPQMSQITSRSDCDITATLGNKTFATPVVAANMKSILTREICKTFDDNNWFYVYHRIDGTEDVYNFVKYANENLFNAVSISIGIKGDWLNLLERLSLMKYRVDYITLDVAHSHANYIVDTLSVIKTHFPDVYLIVGNGCTAEWVNWIESFGLVDCLKVGIGVSSSCRTRQYTGFGSSTLGSLYECVQACKSGIDIMSDGGITLDKDGLACIGDVAKAVVFGADWVMSGALFKNCIDSPSAIHGYYGNASREAKGNNHVEGAKVEVVTNGLTIKEMLARIEESLRSSVSYAGKTKISELLGHPYELTTC